MTAVVFFVIGGIDRETGVKRRLHAYGFIRQGEDARLILETRLDARAHSAGMGNSRYVTTIDNHPALAHGISPGEDVRAPDSE